MQPTAQSKRKAAPESSTPLNNGAKRPKKDIQTKTNQSLRNRPTAEEKPGGFFIVRAPSRTSAAPPPSAQQGSSDSFVATTAAKRSAPDSSNSSNSITHTRRVKPRLDQPESLTPASDSQVESDVRAMEDEADHLRRHSRRFAPDSQDHSATHDQQLNGSSFNFPPPTEGITSKPKKPRIIDTSVLLPDNDSPQIARNRQMRNGVMAKYLEQERSQSTDSNAGTPGGHHRRRSSISRGKRISGSYEATGVISQPHASVDDSSFYKHLDCDIPEPARMRQLLVWCHSRASTSSAPSSSSMSKKSATSSTKDPLLPSLSEKGTKALKDIEDHVLKMLADKDINTAFPVDKSSAGKDKLKDNPQNVKNRQWEIVYGEYIERAKQESKAWEQVAFHYAELIKKLETEISSVAASTPNPELSMSTKAKGKQRAQDNGEDMDVEDPLHPFSWRTWIPKHSDLPEGSGAHSLELAQSILEASESTLSPSSSAAPSSSTAATNRRTAREAKIRSQLSEVEWKLDYLHTLANTAMQITNVAEVELDMRFATLSLGLTSRYGDDIGLGSRSPTAADGTSVGGTSISEMLSAYLDIPVQRLGSGLGTGPSCVVGPTTTLIPGGGVRVKTDPQELFRALARVDKERKPGDIGDAARRALREVKRAEESGAVKVGERERRLTIVGAGGGEDGGGAGSGQGSGAATPRKGMPGTPRRGNTPARDRRERTPGR